LATVGLQHLPQIRQLIADQGMTFDKELDDLAASADPALLAALHPRLDDLRSCKADRCRTAESAPLNLPS
jgi:hypothetical protein